MFFILSKKLLVSFMSYYVKIWLKVEKLQGVTFQTPTILMKHWLSRMSSFRSKRICLSKHYLMLMHEKGVESTLSLVFVFSFCKEYIIQQRFHAFLCVSQTPFKILSFKCNFYFGHVILQKHDRLSVKISTRGYSAS